MVYAGINFLTWMALALVMGIIIDKITHKNQKFPRVVLFMLGGFALNEFSNYQIGTRFIQSDDLEFCVYIEADNDTTDFLIFKVLIQVQLFKLDQGQEYHSVIMPFLKKYITAEFVGFEIRDSITSDHWPMDLNGSSFIYYFLAVS